MIETLRFLLCISVSKKPFARAVFGMHRVKVLLCDNDFSLSAAHFLYWNCPKISVSIKKWNRKNLPRPFVSTVGLFVSALWLSPIGIIYRICLRYILGFSNEILIEKNNIRLCNTWEYAKKQPWMQKSGNSLIYDIYPDLYHQKRVCSI